MTTGANLPTQAIVGRGRFTPRVPVVEPTQQMVTYPNQGNPTNPGYPGQNAKNGKKDSVFVT